MLIEDEKHQSLRDGLLQLCVNLHPLDGPMAVIRTDPAPGFKSLVNDVTLAKYRLSVELGRAKTVNKNPVAEKAIQELETGILRQDPLCRAVTPIILSLATARLNTRIRKRGMSAREMLFQRDQFYNRQIPVEDQSLLMQQHDDRNKNHPYSR
ncbi:hypothetical protein KP79_PYT26060 [Mizuhopecten yessoensis]|uniref:Integrase catalytic domain-containing protein n=1 Tax=Mizuhopecten yessoensis TaxID=6573 RepID=A0A210PHK2_MIZYE|nr:hypothetical protein KP79_PYT26060 [Mizuhopecten yessoensis]